MSDTDPFPWRNDNDTDSDDGEVSRLDTSITDDPVPDDSLDGDAWAPSGL